MKANNKKIGRKVNGLLLGMMTATMLLSGGISIYSLYAMKRLSVKSSEELGRTAAIDAEIALEEQAVNHLTDIAKEKALYIEEKYGEVESYVRGIAAQAEDIYASLEDDSDKYPDREVGLPVADSHKLAAQLLWSNRLAPTSADGIASESEVWEGVPVFTAEVLKLGNLQDMLVQYNANNDMVSSVYLATESGWMIQADYIAYSKYAAESKLPMFYEADTREWYQLALNAKEEEVVYTGVMADIHAGGDCIVCAAPVYYDGRVVAVAGVGSYMKTVKDAVMDTAIGEQGYAFLVNEKGEVIASGKLEGETAPSGEQKTDLRESGNTALAEAAVHMVAGETGYRTLILDEKEVYLAYAPLTGLGWSFVTVMDAAEIVAPARESQMEILERMQLVETDQKESIRRMFLLFGALFVISALFIGIFGSMFSEHITKPIRTLTGEVAKIGDGNLDYRIHIRTGDEIQALGDAFNRMAEQIQQYISNLAAVTAEKERIRTEIEVAARLQADMLPEADSAFEERSEFSLAAFMNPAKGVGGDFYDFFLLDEEHLVLIMADVSGKGVPAALFMVVARTLIHSILLSGLPFEQAAGEINVSLCRNNNNGMFVTAWLGILAISTGELEFINAGHCRPLVLHEDGTAEYVSGRSGFVFAGMEDSAYRSIKLQLQPGDTLFLYTDGVTEATAADGELYGEERLKTVAKSVAEKSPGTLTEWVWQDIEAFQAEAEQFDDVTMLAITYNGEEYRRKSGKPDIAFLPEYREFLEITLNKHKIVGMPAKALILALDEIYSNICYYSEAGQVSMEIKIDEVNRCVILIFEDDGIPYDPLQKADPKVDVALTERQEGGLGIYLVKQLMDGIGYYYIGGKNRLVLVKEVIKKPSPPTDDIPAVPRGV